MLPVQFARLHFSQNEHNIGKEFKSLRKQIVHSIFEKQNILNQMDAAVAPPLSMIFDETLRKLTAYKMEAE